MCIRDRGKTVLMIAHRLSTVRNMDRILVIRDGEIAEEGDVYKRQHWYPSSACPSFLRLLSGRRAWSYEKENQTAPYPQPVSYTHLDVYKRQPLAVFLPCAVWRVLKKNMLKHPRHVNREALC